jgi:hypothetical protein
MSQPIITPRKFLQAIYGRDTLPPEVAGCTCAVIAFLCGQSCGGVVGGLYVWCPMVSKLPPGTTAIGTFTTPGECSKTSSSRRYPGYWDNSPLASSAVSS